MGEQTKNILKSWFKTGKKPTEEQFSDVFDSYIHKFESLNISNVSGLPELLAGVATIVQLNSGLSGKANVVHTHSGSDLEEWLGYTPQDTEEKNQPDGYPGLDANGKILVEQLPTILNLTSGILYDSTGLKASISFFIRVLNDSAGIPSVLYNSRIMGDSNGRQSINWNLRQLYDNIGNAVAGFSDAGLTYAKDFSGTYTARSLVDKAYVDRLKPLELEIGEWAMNTDTTYMVAHSITNWKEIRKVSGIVRSDDDTKYSTMDNSAFFSWTLAGITSTHFILSSGGGDFTEFDTYTGNRGFLTIEFTHE